MTNESYLTNTYTPDNIREIEEWLDNLANTTNNHYILKWLQENAAEEFAVPLGHPLGS